MASFKANKPDSVRAYLCIKEALKKALDETEAQKASSTVHTLIVTEQWLKDNEDYFGLIYRIAGGVENEQQLSGGNEEGPFDTFGVEIWRAPIAKYIERDWIETEMIADRFIKNMRGTGASITFTSDNHLDDDYQLPGVETMIRKVMVVEI